MAYDHDLAERMRAVFSTKPGITEKEMFGGLCFLVHGNMICGIAKNDFMARIDPKKYEELLQSPDVRQMDFTGRPLRGYLFVSPDGVESEEKLTEWVNRCYEYTSTLLAKKKKK